MRRPIGIVRIRLVQQGRIVWKYEGRNLFVNAGLPALAALLGGDTSRRIRGGGGIRLGIERTGGDRQRADHPRIL